MLRGELSVARKFKDEDLEIPCIDSKISEFVFSVKDNCHVLYKMDYLGFFKQETMNTQNNKRGYYKHSGINILISSIATSFAIATVMSPVDLLCYSLRNGQSVSMVVQ